MVQRGTLGGCEFGPGWARVPVWCVRENAGGGGGQGVDLPLPWQYHGGWRGWCPAGKAGVAVWHSPDWPWCPVGAAMECGPQGRMQCRGSPAGPQESLRGRLGVAVKASFPGRR